jgi:hypothetical protein
MVCTLIAILSSCFLSVLLRCQSSPCAGLWHSLRWRQSRHVVLAFRFLSLGILFLTWLAKVLPYTWGRPLKLERPLKGDVVAVDDAQGTETFTEAGLLMLRLLLLSADPDEFTDIFNLTCDAKQWSVLQPDIRTSGQSERSHLISQMNFFLSDWQQGSRINFEVQKYSLNSLKMDDMTTAVNFVLVLLLWWDVYAPEFYVFEMTNFLQGSRLNLEPKSFCSTSSKRGDMATQWILLQSLLLRQDVHAP